MTKLQYTDVMSPHFLHHPCVAFVFCVKQSVVGCLFLQLQHDKQEASAWGKVSLSLDLTFLQQATEVTEGSIDVFVCAGLHYIYKTAACDVVKEKKPFNYFLLHVKYVHIYFQ